MPKALRLLLSFIIIFTSIFADGVFVYANDACGVFVLSDEDDIDTVGLYDNIAAEDDERARAVSDLDGLPSYFMTDAGFRSPNKNQGSWPICWAFVTAEVSETNALLKGIFTDKNSQLLSPLAAAYFTYHKRIDPLNGITNDINTTKNGDFLERGGNLYFSANTLAAWVGPAWEKNAPISSASSAKLNGLSDSLAFDDALHLNCYQRVNIKEEPNAAKKLIMEHGSLAAYINYINSSSYINYPEKAYYYNGSGAVNHAVCIVGWDDDFSASKFKTTPEGDGAWIIRNSHTTNPDDNSVNSYFYLSYYDKGLDGAVYSYQFEPADNYDNNYQYDGGMRSSGIGYSDCVMAANIFNAHASSAGEKLKAVGFEVTSSNTECQVDIYTDLKDLSDPTSGTHETKASASVSTTYPGFYSVKLPYEVNLSPNTDYSVVVTINKPGSNTFIGREQTISGNFYNIKTDCKPQQSFIKSKNAKAFTDLYTSYHANVRIKAYTDNLYAIEYITAHSLSNNNLTAYDITDLPIALSAPEYSENYSFDGWYLDSDYTVPVTEITEFKGNFRLYAKEHVLYQTISCNFPASVIDFNNKSRIYESELPYTLNPPVLQAGCSFRGWYSDAKFTKPVSVIDNIEEPISLYAAICDNTTQLSYKKVSDDGSETEYEINLVKGNTFEFPDFDFTDKKGGRDYTIILDNPKILSISKKGIIKAKKSGICNVTLISDTGQKYQCCINIQDAFVSKKLIINKDNGVDLACYGSINTEGTYLKAGYISSKPDIASVSKDGIVKGQNPGSCQIIVKIGDKQYKTKVQVIDPYISEKVPDTVAVGKKLKFSLKKAKGNITYTSSNPEIMAINENGAAAAVSEGTVVISANINGRVLTKNIKVTAN